LEVSGDRLLEIDVNDGGEQLVHPLLVRNVGIDLAPHEEDACEQLEDVGVLEELHFLVGTIDVLLDFFI
jgi:hypothetical protein